MAAWLETGPLSAKELAVIATLAGAAAAARLAFAALPDVKPVTVMVVSVGIALGLRAGILVGALSALVSNFFFGQGPWTPWQMLAWAACGALGALLAPFLRRRLVLAAVCFLLGFAFNWFMDAQLWWSYAPHTLGAFVTVVGRGIWFDVAAAVGNVVFALVAGAELRRVLERYGRRLRTEVVWA
jgi:energy-coupling factor transport system substrate-specific component